MLKKLKETRLSEEITIDCGDNLIGIYNRALHSDIILSEQEFRNLVKLAPQILGEEDAA